MISLLQDVPVWLNVLVAIVGTVVCAMNIGRSRWAALLAAGFFGETISMAFSRLAVMAMRHGVNPGSMGAALFLAGMIGLASRAAIVGGVVALLSDLRKPTAA